MPEAPSNDAPGTPPGPSAEASAPLLRAEGLRLEANGAVLVSALSFEAAGDRVGVLGDLEPVFAVLSARARVVSGSLTLLGRDATTAVADNWVGVWSPGQPAPPTFTTAGYLEAAARLAGVPRQLLSVHVGTLLGELRLEALAERRVGTLSAVERVVVGIAQAAVGRPSVLALSRPFRELSDAEAEHVAQVIERATRRARLIVGFDAPAAVGAEARCLTAMDQVVVLGAGRVRASGPPSMVLAPGPRCVVQVARHGDALARALSQHGLRVEQSAEGGDRFVVHLRRGESTRAITQGALALDAPLLELLPTGFVTEEP